MTNNAIVTAPLVAVGLFTFPDHDGRWYVAADWNVGFSHSYATFPVRIVSLRDDDDTIDNVESLFNAGGFVSEADAVAAINNTEIS
jgi:hypothetical protein